MEGPGHDLREDVYVNGKVGEGIINVGKIDEVGGKVGEIEVGQDMVRNDKGVVGDGKIIDGMVGACPVGVGWRRAVRSIKLA